MNDNKEFENSLKKENANDNVANFLELNNTVIEGQFLLNYMIKGMGLLFP